MDIYYRADRDGLMGYAKLRGAPITTAAQHLSAAAARMAKSIVWSLPLLGGPALEHLKSLLTVDSLWSLCIVISAWLIATVLGGPIALGINGILILWGLSDLWDQLGDILKDFKAWASSAYEATDDKELAKASALFAGILAEGGITALELVLTHRLFRFAEVKIRERFKPPDWLGREYQAAVREAEKRKRPKPVERVIETAKVVGSASRGRGMQEAANRFPTGAVIVGGVLAAMGVTAVAAYALSQEGDKK